MPSPSATSCQVQRSIVVSPSGRHRRRRHDEGQGQPVETREGPTRALAQHDVGRPHRSRGRGEGDADLVEAVPGVVEGARHEGHPEPCGQHGQQVAGSAGEHGRQGERPEELDRHGHPDRQVGQRRVEGGVHRREREPEEHDGDPVRAGAAPPRGAGDGIQDRGGEEQPQQHRAGGADARHEGRREGAAELHRHHTDEDEQRGGAVVDSHGCGSRPAATRVARRSGGRSSSTSTPPVSEACTMRPGRTTMPTWWMRRPGRAKK